MPPIPTVSEDILTRGMTAGENDASCARFFGFGLSWRWVYQGDQSPCSLFTSRTSNFAQVYDRLSI
jgi:hypothetical protein